MKTRTIVILGLVVLGIGRITAQTIPPHLNLYFLDFDGPIFSLTAGSDPIPQGFNIMIESGHSAESLLINVSKFSSVGTCSFYALQPFQESAQFRIWADPALNDDDCQTYRNMTVLPCDVVYEYVAHIRNSRVRTAPITLNVPCQ